MSTAEDYALCRVPGCDRLATTRGVCAAHYNRFKRTGDVQAHKPIAPYPGTKAHIIRQCSAVDCEKVARRDGLCIKHYTRRDRYGDVQALNGTPRGTVQAWMRDHAQCSSDACQIWPFTKDKTGYGLATYNGRQTIASRAMCEIVHGPAPTHWHQAAHSCGKGHLGCVNPRHLRWATPSENMADKRMHGTAGIGENSPNAKLSESQAQDILNLRGLFPQRQIAAKHCVTVATVSAIHTGKIWKHLSRRNT